MMTTNQLAYHNLLESQRANREKERENFRSNLAKERENYRSNTTREREEYRSNKERERENRRSNKANERIKKDTNQIRKDELSEAFRHNKVQEGIGISDSVSKHVSSIGNVVKGIGSLLS